MTAPIDSASPSTPTRSALGRSACSALDDYRPHPASHAAQIEAGRRYYRECAEAWRYAIRTPRNKPRFKPNLTMVDGNGEKVQILIAGTFEGYDAVKVKFFC